MRWVVCWALLGLCTAFAPPNVAVCRALSSRAGGGAPHGHTGLTASGSSSQEEAQRMLRACGGDINKAMSYMFERGLARIREADPVLFEAIVQTRRLQMLQAQTQRDEQAFKEVEARVQELVRDDPELQDAVRKTLVAITWDTVALFTASGGSITIDAELNKRLKTIARASVDKKDTLSGPVIDVGCGTGVLLPHLRSQGLADVTDYVGIDVSAEMINIAQTTYPKAQWLVQDFDKYNCARKARAVIFNNSLQFFKDHTVVLSKAASMLQSQGKIVIAHVAFHNVMSLVEHEHARNPLVVSSTLPSSQQLQELAGKINAVRMPVDKPGKSKNEMLYLEVLQIQ